MSVRSQVTDYLRYRVAIWRQRRSERYVSSLPVEIRKDIGWPGGGIPEHRQGQPQNSLWERRW